jgi:hypothetical protein
VNFLIRNRITSIEREADVKDMLLHYRRTVILNELLDKESAVQAIV